MVRGTIRTQGDMDLYDRFHECRLAARERMDLDDLTINEFLYLLLDVYEYHLHDHPTPEPQGTAHVTSGP